MPVYRIFVEKRPEYAVEAKGTLSDLKTALRPQGLESLRILNRYDVEGISEEVFKSARATVFSEPQVDVTYDTLPDTKGRVFAIEYLPGQFDQRADSCSQCIQLLTQGDRPVVRSVRVFILEGSISDETFEKIKDYLINPVESREAKLDKAESLAGSSTEPAKVKILKNFTNLTHEQLSGVIDEFGLAMDVDDLEFCRDYFKTEQRAAGL